MLAIQQAGLDTGNASFETAAPGWDVFDQGKLPLHRHVAVAVTGEVLSWVAASPVPPRPVCRGVIEHSVYVHPGAQGHGAGGALLAALTGGADAAGIWTIQTGIFPEKHRQLPTAPAGWLPHRRYPEAHRRPPWPLARRHPSRTPQYRHGDLTRLRGGAADGPGFVRWKPVTIGL